METFSSGAYIIDMGQATQSVAKGLKPYGLVYTLIKDHNVALRWVINPSKSKDGIDFSYNSASYKGGPFIIPAEYVNAGVTSAINAWKAKGVVVIGPTTSSFDAPVFTHLTSWPLAILDSQNDDIVKTFYVDAEIPAASYVLKGNPTMLSGCDDVYVLPHADPQNWIDSWVTALDNYIKNENGYLWSGCHAASALEAPVSADGVGLPFLSSTGLIRWNKHDDGSGNYTYRPSCDADPIMQFMGKLDGATTNGSEQIYIPIKTTGSWRPTTKVAVYQPTHTQANPNEAAVLVYGRAYGNSDYGMVMYEAGHDLNEESDPANIAAMRAYFNFILLAGDELQMIVNFDIPSTIPAGSTILLNAIVSDGKPPLTYLWTSSAGGSFSDSTGATTTFTAPLLAVPTSCIIKVLVTDDCGRYSYRSETVNIIQVPIEAIADDASISRVKGYDYCPAIIHETYFSNIRQKGKEKYADQQMILDLTSVGSQYEFKKTGTINCLTSFYNNLNRLSS